MDIFSLQALVNEISPLLTGHRPGRIYQLGATDLLMEFGQRDGRRLLISTDPLRLGFCLTHRNTRQFAVPPRNDTYFVSLLLKHLDEARLVEVEPLGYDRVVKLHFHGDNGGRTLVISLTGRSANIILLNGAEILGELREREEPIELYVDPPPPRDRIDPLSCLPERLVAMIGTSKEELALNLQRRILGFTPLLAREAAARIEHALGGGVEFEEAWIRLLDDLTAEPMQPIIFAKPSLKELKSHPGIDEFELILSPCRMSHLDSQFQTLIPTVNEAVETTLSILEERRRFLGLRQRLSSLLNGRLKKLSSLLANLEREEKRYSEAEVWQRYGDLLLTNLHQAVETDGGYLVVDYFDENQGLIEIDGAGEGTVKGAAEHYFRLARKGRHSRESIAARRPAVEAEATELKRDRDALATIDAVGGLQPLAEKYGLEVAEERSQGSLPKKQREEKLPGVRRYRSSDGYEILVGRTDRDNDFLTLRIAKSFDIWFHAADYPGSHVVLRNPSRQAVPQRSISEAAQLAARFSQAKDSPRVGVNYCEKKYVTKPKGFAPGQVRLSSFKTILVAPAEAGERL